MWPLPQGPISCASACDCGSVNLERGERPFATSHSIRLNGVAMKTSRMTGGIESGYPQIPGILPAVTLMQTAQSS
jgi:hypothetical protein